ncbi:MAG TPA: hypothetical protein VHX39_30365 [Acetobacteraceae bacterium]|jgi:hypothetical protein|nr:hypothetical protein [Acetobacteraceae bacterium]
MNWPSGGQWEWAIGEIIILPLLFFELYRLRRSQRRDRERAKEAATADDDRRAP